MAKKLTYEFVKSKFEEQGYTLISTSYDNNRDKLDYICPAHGKQSISYAKLSMGQGCRYCGQKVSNEAKMLTFDFVKSEYEKKGYIVISKEYRGSKHDIDYICPRHGITKTSYATIKNGGGCLKCGYESLKREQSLDYDFVYQQFKARGYELLTKTYTNNRDKLQYVCPIHGNMDILYNNFSKGAGCSKCANDAMKSNGNPSWQGGVTDLSTHIRNEVVYKYHKDIIKLNNFTCELSNIRGCHLEVHHTYAFRLILEDTLALLNLPVNPSVGEYTEEELSAIRSVFTEIQASHESIVLSKEIHKLFHDIYGRIDFTIADFQEFRERYDSGEFTELLTA